MKKHFISANQLLSDSFELGAKVAQSNFTPTFVLGLWRGGAPVAIAIQELLAHLGIPTRHSCIKTAFYKGISETKPQVAIEGLGTVIDQLLPKDKLLIVDDVFDTGRTMGAVLKELQRVCKTQSPEIKLATPYFKPENNQTNLKPDYYLKTTSEWLVFPHELLGLTNEEILSGKTVSLPPR